MVVELGAYQIGSDLTIRDRESAALCGTVARRQVILNDCTPRVGEPLPHELSRYGMATFSLITRKGTRSFEVIVPGRIDTIWRWASHGRQIRSL